MVRQCESPDTDGWLALRRALWSHCTVEEHRSEMEMWCADPRRYAAFVAISGGRPVGFAEVVIRHDHVNGTDASPVGFLEGIYVEAEFRRQGVARSLVAAAEHWVAASGCRQLASDADLDNETSHSMHRALGFRETERVVCFCKDIT